jgi:GntR family transcriptional regulator
MEDDMWLPGERLPSEFVLAKGFGVSQGAVRKSLDALAHENLLNRHQGRGTFLSSYSDQCELFLFFHLIDKNYTAQSLQTSHLISHKRRKYLPKENKCL